ncbi:unnamed protein product [Hyaloperonospora brassicae]|uniref:Myosin-binding domain-containing protein n=1 Tax=Hyaloperonospora brassicae TaxID=162125 RepID=A0AAV0UHA3_HYABA|nr:unnamed protein product [Hyaloperonospora brassicae]
MEVVVAASSPLGQYLTQLEATAASDSETRPQWLSAPRAAVPTERRIRDQASQMLMSWRWMKRLLEIVRRHIEVAAVQRLIPELCAFHPTIREDLQQAGASDPAVFRVPSKFRKSGWCSSVAALEVLRRVREVGTDETKRAVLMVYACAALMVAIVTAITGRGDGEHVLLQTMKVIVAATTFFLLGLEVGVRLLHAWYARCSRRLVGSLSAFVVQLETFNEVYASSLALVKRAELASRGYRLGTGLLPPIGRLEASTMKSADHGRRGKDAAMYSSTDQLRCVPLRRKLRTLNQQLFMLALTVEKSDRTIDYRCQDHSKDETTAGEQTPSLLLTALTKQHNRAMLLLESAVHSALVRTMTRACLPRSRTEVGWSLFRALDSQRFAVERLIATLSTCADDLDAWNTSRSPMALQGSDRATKLSGQQQQRQHVALSSANDTCPQNVASTLYELRSTSETLAALVVAAQHELLPADTVAERLTRSRDAMHSMVVQLQEAWAAYDSALSALTGRADQAEIVSEGAVTGDKVSHEMALVSPVAPSSVPAREATNCTVVFTGTSTGDNDFDLQALLKRQEAQSVVIVPGSTPNFVRELRNVLAYRQAHAQPGHTKQVDQDPPALSTSAPEAPLLPPCAAMFAPPHAPPRRQTRRLLPVSSRSDTCSEVTARAVNLELHALLQQSQLSHYAATECLGDSDVDDDADWSKRLTQSTKDQ